MKNTLILFAFLTSHLLFAQSAELKAFENLVGSTWVSNGKQLGGHDGKTVKEISLGLDGNLIKVKTFTTDPQTLQFGLRNEGVRIYNSESKQILFYEFDKFGGVTNGVVKVENKDLHYEYVYGEYLLRDSWIYVSDNEYEYRVCAVTKTGECLQTYHEGKFTRKKM